MEIDDETLAAARTAMAEADSSEDEQEEQQQQQQQQQQHEEEEEEEEDGDETEDETEDEAPALAPEPAAYSPPAKKKPGPKKGMVYDPTGKKKPGPKKGSKYKTVPGKPKRPKSAYSHFMGDVSKEVHDENPTLSRAECMKLVGARWKALGDSERAPYTMMAAQSKQAYEEEIEEWQRTHPPEVDMAEASAVGSMHRRSVS